jgi:hypothetical protein
MAKKKTVAKKGAGKKAAAKVKKAVGKPKKSTAKTGVARTTKVGAKKKPSKLKKPKTLKPAARKTKTAVKLAAAVKNKVPAKKPAAKPKLKAAKKPQSSVTPPVPVFEPSFAAAPETESTPIESTPPYRAFDPMDDDDSGGDEGFGTGGYNLIINIPDPATGIANVKTPAYVICTQGTAFDRMQQGPLQAWAKIYPNPPGMLTGAPAAGATQGTVSGQNWTVDPVPDSNGYPSPTCNTSPNPLPQQWVVVWCLYRDGTWFNTNRQFGGQCAAQTDCGT